MRYCIVGGMFMCLSLLGAAAGAQDGVTGEAATRAQVDELIRKAPEGRATLGTLQGTIELSISFGAPAWNARDHDACCRFYMKTAESLCTTFAAPERATPAARAALTDLRTALDRAHQSTDVDANAWTMRYAFDKTLLSASIEAQRAIQLLALGQECAARSQFADAGNAFATATASLRELDGQPVDHIPVACRFAPLAWSDALFGQKQYGSAAAAVEQGLHFIPEWPSTKGDLRKHFADSAIYQLLFEDLRAAAARQPGDAPMQFLLGYHLYFTGQRDAARPYFERALKIDAKHAGAARMLEEYDPNRPKRPPPPSLPDSFPRGGGTPRV
jgi:tetratricopeptide (TPR) repeat protein